MTKEEVSYFISLDEETRLNVLNIMDGDMQTMGGGCSNSLKPKPEDGATPNGEWVCINSKWTWVPSIG
jgi:hypothetical protein